MNISIHAVRRCTQAAMMILMAAGAIHFSPAFFLLMFIIALFFGPVFCGWLCPFGFLQELVGQAGKFLRKRLGIRVPDLPYRTRYIRIAAALLMLAGMAAGVLTMEGGSADSILFAVALAVLLALNLFWPRFFCRTLCPMGALLGLTNLIKIYPVRVQAFCVGCGRCNAACPMGVQPGQRGDNRDIGCIACMECCGACPVKSGLKVQAGGNRQGGNRRGKSGGNRDTAGSARQGKTRVETAGKKQSAAGKGRQVEVGQGAAMVQTAGNQSAVEPLRVKKAPDKL